MALGPLGIMAAGYGLGLVLPPASAPVFLAVSLLLVVSAALVALVVDDRWLVRHAPPPGEVPPP